MPEDTRPQGELARLQYITRMFAKHGWRGVSARLGIDRTASAEPLPTRPETLVELLQDLGPVAVKLGQILATRDDLLGPEWTGALATLQDNVAPLPYEDIASVLLEDLGAAPEEVFSSFDRTPIAAASIAQVHAARLKSGEEVVVKVRRPGMARIVDADLRLLRRLARLAERRMPEVARLRPDELLRAFSKGLSDEMDLSSEARAAEEFGEFLKTLGITVPKFYWEYTSHRVNVQQRLSGFSVSDERALENIDPHLAATSYSQAVLRMILFNGLFHADPHPGNVWVQPDGSLAFIDFGAVGRLSPARRDEIVRLILAIAGENHAQAVDVLLDWAGRPAVDRSALEDDIAALIDQFKGTLLAQIQLSAIFEATFAILRTHHLGLPPDLALMLRTLLIAEGVVRRLKPDFDIAAELAPLARELMLERLDPRRAFAIGKSAITSVAALTSRIPELAGHLERYARTGKIEVAVESNPDELIAATIRKSGRQLAISIAASGMLVAAAIVSQQSSAVGISIAIVAVMAFIVTMLRKT